MFNGSLFSIGGADFPLEFIFKESYHVWPRRLDLDSTRNITGELMRNVLAHTASKITFQTKPMYNYDFRRMMDFIQTHMIDVQARKFSLIYYCPDTDDYAQGTFYMPDVDINIDLVDSVNKTMLYRSSTISFIEY